MRKIIEGLRYDTETAELLGEYEYSYPGDFAHVWEGLFRTPKGALFIAGKGGPQSKYVRQTGRNECSGGDGIKPVTKEDAIAWCEAHGQDEAIEEYFEDEVEDA